MAGNDSDLTRSLIEAEKARQKQVERDAVIFKLDDFQQCDLETYNSFISPKEALARFPYEKELAITQLRRELQFGRVVAICDEGVIFYNSESFTVKLATLHGWHWWQQMPRLDDDFWETGYLEVMIPEKMGGMSFKSCGSLRYFGVRFDPAGLPEVKDNIVSLPERKTEITKSVGGRARKGWWDDLWLEMIQRIEQGNLEPESAAALQRLMETWLGENDIYPGDSTLKPMARKLFKYLKERRGKT